MQLSLARRAAQIILNPRSLNLRCKDGMPLEAVITAGLAHRNIIATLAHFWTSRDFEAREVILDGERAVPRDAGSGPEGLAFASMRGVGALGSGSGEPCLGPGIGSGQGSPAAGGLWDSANRRRVDVPDSRDSEVGTRGAGSGGAREDEVWLIMDYCDRGCLLARSPRPIPLCVARKGAG